MKKFLALFLLASSVFAQQQVQPVAGVLTLNLVPGTTAFKVILTANVTSVVIVNPTPGTIISVIFTENATGGFTVAFGGNIANPCTVTTTANATTTCQFQFDATSNTWNGIGGGGVNVVTSLPASCTSTSSQVLLVVNGASFGTFVCDPNGGNVWIPENPNQTISPYAYGAVGHVRYTWNAAWTNASQTVTCSNGECNFQCPGGVYPCTSSTSGCPSLTCDAGKIVKGSATFPQVNAHVFDAGAGNTLPQGTISTVTNSTTITVSNAAINTCPIGSLTTCTLSWGVQDDTTAIKAAETAAWGNHSRCIALQYPADNFYITPPVFNGPQASLKAGDVCSTLASANGGSDITNTGPSMYGAGEGTTTFIILSINYAGCTFGSGGVSCMGTMPNLQAHDFMITGLGDIGTGTQGVVFWESVGSNAGGACDGGITAYNLSFNSFGIFVNNSSGFKFGAQSCADAVINNVSVDMFGKTPCTLIGSQPVVAYSIYCAGGGANSGAVLSVSVASGAQLNTYGSEFVCYLTTGGAIASVSGGGKWNSNGDVFLMGAAQCPSAGSGFLSSGGFQIDMNDDFFSMGNSLVTGSVGYNMTNTGSILHATNTILNGNAQVGSALFSTGATDKVFFDGSGNKITNAGNANTFSGPVFGITNSSVGTVCATGNFALTSGWGTSTVSSVAANGNIQGCHVTITGAAGAASPVLTWTYPAAPIVAPGSCHILGVSGTLTGVAVGTPGATTVAFTFAGTPSAQTYVFDVGCP